MPDGQFEQHGIGKPAMPRDARAHLFADVRVPRFQGQKQSSGSAVNCARASSASARTSGTLVTAG